MKRTVIAWGLALPALGGLIVCGPRAKINLDEDIRAPRLISDDLPDLSDAIAKTESQLPIVEGTEKRITWFNGFQKTPWSVVAIHGFSSSRQETAPLAKRVAHDLRANLFETRLRGHGRRDDVLHQATASMWIEDAAYAFALGQKLGDRVLVIAVSTGATLAALAISAQLHGSQSIGALALISPNFGLRPLSTRLLSWPWMPLILPAFVPRRSFQPINDAHGRYWTEDYRVEALFEMQALIDAADRVDFSSIRIPTLLIASAADDVVDFQVTEEIAARWPTAKLQVVQPPAGAPSSHVLAGDILNPTLTSQLQQQIGDFLEAEVMRSRNKRRYRPGVDRE